MAAEIETAITANTAAWWDYDGSHVHDGLMDIPTAMELGGIDWTVSRVPIEYLGNDTPYALIVRDTDEMVLGSVGPGFVPIQNQEGADLLEKVLASSDLGIETALSLRSGKIVVITARTPEHIRIAGEEHISYTTVANWHDGSGTAKIYTGVIRAVCANTLQAGLLSAKSMMAFRHVGNPMARAREAQETLQMTFDYSKEIQKFGEELAAKRMTDSEFDAFLKELVVVPKEADPKDVAPLIRTREGIRQVYGESENLNNIRGTAWGALNAVVEFNDHGRNYRSDAKRFEDILTQSQTTNRQAMKLLAKA